MTAKGRPISLSTPATGHVVVLAIEHETLRRNDGAWGTAADVVGAADTMGRRKRIAIVRPSTGRWYILKESNFSALGHTRGARRRTSPCRALRRPTAKPTVSVFRPFEGGCTCCGSRELHLVHLGAWGMQHHAASARRTTATAKNRHRRVSAVDGTWVFPLVRKQQSDVQFVQTGDTSPDITIKQAALNPPTRLSPPLADKSRGRQRLPNHHSVSDKSCGRRRARGGRLSRLRSGFRHETTGERPLTRQLNRVHESRTESCSIPVAARIKYETGCFLTHFCRKVVERS